MDALICDDTISFFSIGKGLSLSSLSRLLKKQFVNAVLGACFCLDSVAGCNVVLDHLLRLSPSEADLGATNPKSHLQHHAQRIYNNRPTYSVISEDGPDHDKSVLVKASIPGAPRSAQGRGKNKQLAEQAAATSLLLVLGAPAKGESARPATFAQARNSNGSDIATWSPDKWLHPRSTNRYLHDGTSRFLHFFREHTGLQLPPELAEIVVTHSSLKSELSRRCGPKECGLTVLGNCAYNYGIAAAIFRDQDSTQVSAQDLQARISSMVTALGSNRYKARLAQPWSVHIRIGPGIKRPFPDSILLDAFEGSLGAATLIDLRNLDAISVFLRDKLSTDADFAKATVEAGFSREMTGIAKSQLQQLSQMCFPDGQQFDESVFSIHVAGPFHAQQMTCRIVGDQQSNFSGAGASRSAATKVVCDKTLAFVCEQIAATMPVSSGVKWIDAIVDSMRANLLDEPSEGSWLKVRFETLPFPRREFWEAVSAAVRHPHKTSITSALQSIRDNRELTFAQTQRLSTFLSNHTAERGSVRVLQVVQLSLMRLLDQHNEKTAEHAISVVCSSLQIMTCLQRHNLRWATVPDIVVDALSILAPGVDTKVCVPARIAHIEYESYLTILQQLRACHDSKDDITVAILAGNNSSPVAYASAKDTITVAVHDELRAIQIRGSLSGSGIADHEPLFLATWELCDLSRCGYSVVGTGSEFIIEIPLRSDVIVNCEGLCDDATTTFPGGSGPESGVSPEVERAKNALHEIKNRMIASPARWMEEIRECATDLKKVADIMRAPQPERVESSRIGEIIDEAVAKANATYGIVGEVGVIYDEDFGYVDVKMVATILRNLADNASRAASEGSKGAWGIEGIITASEIDVNVWNTCRNTAKARVNVEAGGGRSSSLLGTGIGVPTIKRLAGKLLGRVTYQFDEREVCARVVLPIDLATVSWMLEDE